MSEQGKQVQVRVMGPDGEWSEPEQVPAMLAALAAMREDIEQMSGTYSDRDLHRIRQELNKLSMTVARRVAGLSSRPMKASELGRYVCVPSGSCLHSPGITISADGVWVRSPGPDPLYPGRHVYSSAHRDCYERRAASEQQAGQPVLNDERAYLILTAIDPVTMLPLMSPDDAHQMLRTATHHGIATWRDGGRQVTVASNDGVFFNISTT